MSNFNYNKEFHIENEYERKYFCLIRLFSPLFKLETSFLSDDYNKSNSESCKISTKDNLIGMNQTAVI